ncbi:MAG TPA: hypothetical protein VKB93_13225 [Thermoanaerobaculia bacterium]|nr:hypothetical protein [Thermoanaerobaculia bacterium]
MARKLSSTLTALVVGSLFVASSALAVDEGQTQPKVNMNATNSSSTPVDVVPSTNGNGNVKGVSCALTQSGGNFPGARVKFTIDGGTVQTVDLYEFQAAHDDGAGTIKAYTGWVPFNLRFGTSIRVQIQKTSPSGGAIDCAVSWALD